MPKNINGFYVPVIFILIIIQIACWRVSFEDFAEVLNPQSTQTYQGLNPYDLCVPERYPAELGIVIKVIDGDSIRVKIKDEMFEVRYIGMNTPEYGENTDQAAINATNQNRKLVEGKQVALYRDVSDTDRYDRLLRYVFIDGIFVNRELVTGGYAKVRAYPPDIACHQVIAGN
jgi:endonuclease YncB( thermonuclease family)